MRYYVIFGQKTGSQSAWEKHLGLQPHAKCDFVKCRLPSSLVNKCVLRFVKYTPNPSFRNITFFNHIKGMFREDVVGHGLVILTHWVEFFFAPKASQGRIHGSARSFWYNSRTAGLRSARQGIIAGVAEEHTERTVGHKD
jgi:hypothetical protein